MPSLQYGTGAYKRDNGSFPPLSLINMYPEKARTSEGGYAILSRPGLVNYSTVGTGPINGAYTGEGVFSSQVFFVSNATAYRGSTSMGAVDGSGIAEFAAYSTEIILARGATAYSYNGTNFAAIVTPGAFNVSSVVFIGSLFVFAQAQSQKFWWSDPLDGRTIQALNFATAEREGDELLQLAVLDDNLLLFGQRSVEMWAHTGDTALPFVRFEQIAFDKGIRNARACANVDNSVCFIASDNRVYRWGEAPQRISDHWLETKIEASTTVTAYSFVHEGHEHFVVRTLTESYAFDCTTGEWWELQTSEETNFIGQCAIYLKNTGLLFGSADSGEFLKFSGWQDRGEILERRFTAALPLDAPTSIDSIKLWCNAGNTDDEALDPLIELRLSDDQGRTWSEYEGESLGQTGEFRQVPEWRALGLFEMPGMMAEFRLTDACGLRVSAVKANDPGGGRG